MPLFQFVWQYSNQPIDVLADDVAGLVVNTDTYVPVSDGTTFVDSFIQIRPQGGLVPAGIFGMYNGNEVGLGIDFSQNYYSIGGTNLIDTDYSAQVVANADLGLAGFGATHPVAPTQIQFGLDAANQSLYFEGPLATTVGGSSGNYIKIMIANVPYKIELLDNV